MFWSDETLDDNAIRKNNFNCENKKFVKTESDRTKLITSLASTRKQKKHYSTSSITLIIFK